MSLTQAKGFREKLVHWLNYDPVSKPEAICDFERLRYELRPCDVILVEGHSRVSRLIRWITNSPWTHAALYLGRLHDITDQDTRDRLSQHIDCSPDTQIMVESLLGYGTIANPLSYYSKEHLRICRPRGLNHKDAQNVMRYAISRLGVDYDVRQIFDLLRFLIPWNLLPRRLGSTLFTNAPSPVEKTVCSTMIAESFAYVQFPILPLVKRSDEHGVQLFRRNPKLCIPAHFDYSPFFEIIKYPFVDLTYQDSHRLLPWRGNMSLSGTEDGLYLRDELNTNESRFNTQSLKTKPLKTKPIKTKPLKIKPLDSNPLDSAEE